jgi:hypothetical protein
MQTIMTFSKFTLLALAVLILAMTPAAAQNNNVENSELYVPLIGGAQRVEQAAVEEAVVEAPAVQEVALAGLLQHEPGRLSKITDLDVRLAAGEISDPFGPNTTMVAWDKIAMVFHAEDNKFTRKTYDVDANLGAPVATERAGSLSVNGGGNMSIAAGYFGGAAGWMDTVAAWEYPAGKISVYVQSYNSSLIKSVDATVNSNDPVAGANTGWPSYGGQIRVATGDFDGDGYDEFVVAWEGAGASLNLRVWDVNSTTFVPTAKGTLAGETLGGYKFLSVATGDFNADGRDEIAVAWRDSDNKLAIKVLSVDSAGILTAKVKLVEPVTPGQLAIVTGDFNGDTIDEIAVAFNTQTNATLNLYQVTNNLQSLTRKGTDAPQSGVPGNTIVQEMAGRQLGLQAGDFSADGIDELALVYNAPGTWRCNVSVYSADAALTLTSRTTQYVNDLGCYGDLQVAAGDMNRDVIDEIVIASRYGTELSSNDIDLFMFQVAPDLSSIIPKGFINDADNVQVPGSRYGHLALAVGAFDGKSVRVGQPTYSHMDETLQLVAVINAPPKHIDVLNGEVVDVNFTDRCLLVPCTYAKYETVQKVSTTMALSTNRDWTVSEEVKLKFPYVSASLKASYGESFEKTTTSFSSTEFGQGIEANTDDVVVRLVQSLNIWEYPIYADGSNVVQGHILVVWPDKADPTCTSNCSGAITARIDGKNPASYYEPNHEVNNVMSYSAAPPANIGTTVKSDTKNDLGSNGYEWWVKWTDIATDETKQSTKLNLEASLEVSAWGQSLTSAGSYSEGETTVNRVSFEQSTEIRLNYWGIDPMYSYGVRPFIYFARPDGHLVLDYQVTPGLATPTVETWWERNYTKVDPAFSLPWKDGSIGAQYRLLSKDIILDPAVAAPGAIVDITAKVRNYSLTGVANVLVYFFIGDPDAGGATLIGSATIPTLNPMSSGTATIQLNTTGIGSGGKTLQIYAKIDPNNVIAEVHEDNNKAYAQLPIVAAGSGPGPRTLFVTAEDIVLDPPIPTMGDVVHISATIHAANQTYTWVPVLFWDGNPSAGGKVIGGHHIPLIPYGEEVTVSVDWPAAGEPGEKEVWVTILRHPGDSDLTDNYAFLTVQFKPLQLYLPATSK